jgi:soluble lytic murein transglycosylase-like protein
MSLRAKLVTLAALLALSASAFAADLAVLRNGFSIRHQRREVMGAITRLYFESGKQSGWIDVPTAEVTSYQREEVEPTDASPPARAADIPALVDAAGDRHQVDPDFINSVIKAESSFNPRARSPKGAQGLMQLMPATAAKLGVMDAYEPGVNIEGGTRYLRQLLEQYHGDAIKALAAYNAGPQRVQQYQGVPPYRETRNYVRRVIIDFNRKKLALLKAEAAAAKPPARQRATRPQVADQAESAVATEPTPRP